jgi:AraC family transcriptional regulator
MFATTELRISSYAPRGTMAPHQHDQALMSIVVHGDFREWIGKRERDYARGHAAFFPAGLTHSQEFGAAGARQIIFKPCESWLDYLTDSKARLGDAPHASSEVFRYLGDRLLEEMQHRDALSAVACEGLLLEIVAAFGRHWTATRTDAKAPAWLRAARDFIHENAFNCPSLAQIARAAARHEIHVAREFRRFYGLSVGTYIRRLRTERAALLLLDEQSSICEIAQSCGFASHPHLCREFKAHFGVTPSQYRSRAMHDATSLETR